ncbi:hypothetical protein PILCRDRAFT_15544 [Piloderma croceum F 1598]|uniref:Uncharacterized protein n=1 Tax=Piloderma croceum (strain F 1598) TaxID=765440 RepID=A0A0C3EKB5_PILCF|nr:hypothetical protein PILCRDRAFT_15544 [Piloderma croceum F 1598]
MSYPKPSEAPEEFFHYLKSLNVDIAVTAFVHNRNQPVPGPNGQFRHDAAQNWCEQMDLLVGKLGRVLAVNTDHQDVFGSLYELCMKTIAQSRLSWPIKWRQNRSDEADKKKMEEDRKRLDKLAIEEEVETIKAAEREIELKKQALCDAQKAAHVFVIDNDDEDDDVASVSTVGEQGVLKKMTKRQVEEEARKKMEQTVHATRCTTCTKSNELICTGPIGHACNVCWKVKKSCSNGSRHHTRIKEEPTSPAKLTAKCKAYSTSGANSIGKIEVFNEADIPQGSSKQQKTSAGATAPI